MAFPVEPDNELVYVPTAEDETAGNPEAPVDPSQVPDNDPTVSQPDNADSVATPVEDAGPTTPTNTESVGYSPDNGLSADPAYASVFGVPLESDAPESDQDTGDIYSAAALSPTDAEYDSAPGVIPPVQPIEGLDFWETQTTEDFETEDYGFTVGDDATQVPVSYEIQGREPEGAWRTLATVSATEITTEVRGLPAGEGWTFRIRAVFVTGETGDWSAETLINLPTDLLAPPTPTAPSVKAERGVVTVSWDGLGADASNQPADYKHTVVWVSETGDPSTFTPIGLLFGAGDFLWTNAAYNVNYFFALSSLDLAGNSSARGVATPATLKPLVQEPDIQAELDRINEATGGLITEAGELNDRLAQAETDLVAHDGVIKDLNEVKLPALQGELDANETAVNTLKNTTIPALNSRLGTAETELSTTKTQLNNRLATAESGLTAAQGHIDQLEDDVVLAAKTAAIEDLYVTGVGTIKTAVIDKLWADVVRARKITTDMLLVGGNGDNLIADPLFTNSALNVHRQNVANSAYDAGWYWTGSYWYSRSGVADGQYRMWFPNNLEPHWSSSYDAPVTPGVTYRFQVDAFVSGGTATLSATMRTRNQGNTNSYFFIPGAFASQTGWATMTWEWTPSAEHAFAMPEIVFSNVKGASRLAVKNPSFKPKVDGSLVVAGSITGDHLEVNTVSAAVANVIKLNADAITAGTVNTARLNTDAIAAATASIQKADVSNLTASSATISQAVIDKLWADVIHAKKITADMVIIGAGNNVIPNAKLAQGREGWQSGQWGLNLNNGPGGLPSIWGQGQRNSRSEYFNVEPGQTYRFKVAVMAQYSGTRFYVQLNTNGTGNPYPITNAAPTTSWSYFTGEVTIPANATTAYINAYINHPNGTSTTGYQWFSDWSMIPMASGELIVDGAITTLKLDAKAVTADKIATNAITADKISGGAIDGQVITGATVRTSSSSTRLEMNSTGLNAYKSGVGVFRLNGADGSVRVGASNKWHVGLETSSDNRGHLTLNDGGTNDGSYARFGGGMDKQSSWYSSTAWEHYSGAWGSFAELVLGTEGGSLPTLEMLFTEKVTGTGGYEERVKAMKIDSRSSEFTGNFLFRARWSVPYQAGTMSSTTFLQGYRTLKPGSSTTSIRRMIMGLDETTTESANIHLASGGILYKVSSISADKLDQQVVDESLDDKLLSVDLKTWIDRTAAETTSASYTPETLEQFEERESTGTEDAEDAGAEALPSLRRIPGVVAEEVRDAALKSLSLAMVLVP